jgi:hypothetical protein
MTALEWSLVASLIANGVLMAVLLVVCACLRGWQDRYDEHVLVASWMRDAANAQGKLEVSDRWNTYLRARLDLAAGLNEDVKDLMKDEEEDEE